MKVSVKTGLIAVISLITVDLAFSILFSLEADKSIISDKDLELYGKDAMSKLPHGYSFYSCQLDFIILSFIRTAVLVGSLIGVLYNRQDGPWKIESSSTFSVCLFLSTLVYSPLKLLALSEIKRNFALPWFWAIFVFNILVSAAGGYVWNFILTNIQPPPQPKSPPEKSERNLNIINRPENEEVATLVYEGFLENGSIPNSHVQDDVNKQKKAQEESTKVKIVKSTSLILRLLRYCRREWIWYTFGFIFLLLSSGGMLM